MSELERKLIDAVQTFERDAEHMPVRDALRVERLLEACRRDVRVLKEEIARAAVVDDA